MPRNTKRQRKGRVLDVRSPAGVKLFEKLIVNGPLTMVFVKAKWCGACHRFNDEVWSPLTKLKNKSMNLASVDSEMIGKTSLANVPRKFYPTLLLVGKDKKAATFIDEDGSPTNSMPRNNSLAEDKEALSALVQKPLPPNTYNANKANMSINNNANSSMEPMNNTNSSMESMNNTNSSMQPMNNTNSSMQPMNMSMDKKWNKNIWTPLSDNSIQNKRDNTDNDLGNRINNTYSNRKPVENNPSINIGKSPFENKGIIPSIANTVASLSPIPSISTIASATSNTVGKSQVPDVAADLVASQSKSTTATAGVVNRELKGGRLLRAIRSKTASLKAMLRLRKTQKNRR